MSGAPWPRQATIAIVGFGLIGGSIGLAARRRAGVARVVGIDVSDVVAASPAARAADELIDVGRAERVREAVQDADLLVLAAPVRAIQAHVTELAAPARLATDCGSTKRAVVEAAGRGSVGRFVPGHPMAGDPRGSIEHAREDLFVGRPWLLCPEGVEGEALERVEAFVAALGATPQRMSAEQHDRAVALTSHLPQLMASVLLSLAAERNAGGAAGPSYESATRVAGGGSHAMWRDILATNADEVARAARDFCGRLEDVAQALERDPPDLGPALELLEKARGLKRSE